MLGDFVMKVLAVETATKQLGVALLDGQTLLGSFELLTKEYPHATELPDAVTRLLRSAGLRLKDLEGVVVDIGPGSFTGLRIGVAFVKGLLFGKPTPVAGVSSLDVLAAGLGHGAQPVCVLVDAKQQKVYAARYRLDNPLPQWQGDYLLGSIEQALASCPPSEPVMFLGDGCALYREQILARCPKAQIAPTEFWWPRAPVLARLGAQRLEQGQHDSLERLVPMYLYAQDCGVNPSLRLPNQPRKTARIGDTSHFPSV